MSHEHYWPLLNSCFEHLLVAWAGTVAATVSVAHGMAPRARQLFATTPWIGNNCNLPNQETKPPPTPWSGRNWSPRMSSHVLAFRIGFKFIRVQFIHYFWIIPFVIWTKSLKGSFFNVRSCFQLVLWRPRKSQTSTSKCRTADRVLSGLPHIGWYPPHLGCVWAAFGHGFQFCCSHSTWQHC